MSDDLELTSAQHTTPTRSVTFRRMVDKSYLHPSHTSSKSKKKGIGATDDSDNAGLNGESGDDIDQKDRSHRQPHQADIRRANESEGDRSRRLDREENLFRRTRGNEPLFAGVRALPLTTPVLEVRSSVLTGSARQRMPFSVQKAEPRPKKTARPYRNLMLADPLAPCFMVQLHTATTPIIESKMWTKRLTTDWC